MSVKLKTFDVRDDGNKGVLSPALSFASFRITSQSPFGSKCRGGESNFAYWVLWSRPSGFILTPSNTEYIYIRCGVFSLPELKSKETLV